MPNVVNMELSSVYLNSTHTSDVIAIKMENDTIIPVVSDCRSMAYEHDLLWIAAMVTVSAISTLIALILRKRQARPTRVQLRAPSRPLPQARGKEEEEEMVQICRITTQMTAIRDAGV